MTRRKAHVFERICTVTLFTNVSVMFLAAVTADPLTFAYGLFAAGLSGYSRIYYKEVLQHMPDNRTKHRDLAVRMRWEITNEKDFAPDGRLPTHRELADRYGTTRTTVRRAMQVLIDDGIVTIEQGAGTFLVGEHHPAGDSGYGARANLIETHIRRNAGLGLPIGSAESLANNWSVSVSTVRRVVGKLRTQGVIQRRRDGTYEAP